MAIEIVIFPIKMVIFHSFLYVYQRVPLPTKVKSQDQNFDASNMAMLLFRAMAIMRFSWETMAPKNDGRFRVDFPIRKPPYC
jgi:hypothetical protein